MQLDLAAVAIHGIDPLLGPLRVGGGEPDPIATDHRRGMPHALEFGAPGDIPA